MTTRVAIVGAAGETGTSIANGLLEAGQFSIVALARPASINKRQNVALKERGVHVVPVDLTGPEEDLVTILEDIDVVISAVSAQEQLVQIPLATAAKKAGVKRFLPCGFITVAPPGGIMLLRDEKEQVNNHIKQIRLPYTYVDVGWWYQIAYPRLPSGKIDYAAAHVISTMVGSGDTPSALTDLRDIGKYVARIIIDDRTLNKLVLVYNEVWTPNQVYDLLETMSGEKLERHLISEDEIQAQIEAGKAASKANPGDFQSSLMRVGSEYMFSWGVRGDNTPENARYLGYLTSKELYPDFAYCPFENYLHEVLEGKAKGVYEALKTQMNAKQ